MTASSTCDLDYPKLLACTIQQAIDDLTTGTEPERRAAFRWLFLDEDITPMTYLWCCAMLGEDPIRGRERLYRERPALIHRLQFGPDCLYLNDLRRAARTGSAGLLAAAR